MSPQARAIIIALAGPAVSALGVLWVVVNVSVDTGRELTLRYVLFDPGHLIIAAGIALSAFLVPLSFQVAAAAPEELDLTLPEPKPRTAEGLAARPDLAEGRAGPPGLTEEGWETAE